MRLLATALLVALPGSELAAQEKSSGSQSVDPEELWEVEPGADYPGRDIDPEELERLRSRVEDGGTAETWLAFGAALLGSGDWEGAIPPLRESIERADGAIREDAVFDLALAYAVSGAPFTDPAADPPPDTGEEQVGTHRERLLKARDGFRAILRHAPGAEDARWNLELVERWLEDLDEIEDSGGGQAGGASPAAGGQGGLESERRELSPEEVQRLLDAAAGQEREVQRRRLERNRSRDPNSEKDW